MNCRIARAYGLEPHVPWGWPFRYWRKVRDELIESWKPVEQEEDEDI